MEWRSIDLSRCIREYTDNEIKQQYATLGSTEVEELRRLPCLFAYESYCKQDPKFGVIRDVRSRGTTVRVDYEIIPVDPFITHENLEKSAFDLDVGNWELNRTHWAVKNIRLDLVLRDLGVLLPHWACNATKAVNISSHNFDVGLSFPGEHRGYVESVAKELEHLLGPNAYFYDNNYVSQLAQPSLDVLLQDIYRNRSKIVCVFLCEDYQSKKWCGVEFRAIREIIMECSPERVMFVRMDDGRVDGVFNTDGYVDARRFSAQDVARMISERVELLDKAAT